MANQLKAEGSQLTADSAQLGVGAAEPPVARPTCDVCGSTRVYELRCKVICGNCRTILQSCADL